MQPDAKGGIPHDFIFISNACQRPAVGGDQAGSAMGMQFLFQAVRKFLNKI
jgi:hypothetical protein